jgi:hypothetical protein
MKSEFIPLNRSKCNSKSNIQVNKQGSSLPTDKCQLTAFAVIFEKSPRKVN